jgi:hypothetical protein
MAERESQARPSDDLDIAAELLRIRRGLRVAQNVIGLNHHLPTAQRDEANQGLDEIGKSVDRIWDHLADSEHEVER